MEEFYELSDDIFQLARVFPSIRIVSMVMVNRNRIRCVNHTYNHHEFHFDVDADDNDEADSTLCLIDSIWIASSQSVGVVVMEMYHHPLELHERHFYEFYDSFETEDHIYCV